MPFAIPPSDAGGCGTFEMSADGAIVCGSTTSLRFRFTVGARGMRKGGKLRIGLPNTGWEKPVVPQQRYWDELVSGQDRRLAPFHPVNTTATIRSKKNAAHTLDVMERMLVPDEDPAIAYWRWWITLTLEAADLEVGDVVQIACNDIRAQCFPEQAINVTAYLQPAASDSFVGLVGSPHYLDVVAGPAVRANVVVPSILHDKACEIRVSITDECHAIPTGDESHALIVNETALSCVPGKSVSLRTQSPQRPLIVQARTPAGETRGQSNPAIDAAADGLNLFWGDLHAQSEHHVMHSQRKDFRQKGWSKGISCGTVDECYRYAKEVSLLDFVAITDQGVCLSSRWKVCQEKVCAYHESGRFVVFKGYEAGSPAGHRNVIYAGDEIEPPLDPAKFGNFAPQVMFDHYRGRQDVILIPHHVKTWTDWSLHEPDLEPLMEIYSCWGQSESPGMDLWNKAQTPAAGAWEALRRGYKLGMIASSDNHVGMPGRSYPGDRQAQTPFKGGLCAIWAESLTRESLFAALRARRCYGTTGDRIILRFSIDGQPMGSILPASDAARSLCVEVQGTTEVDRVEVVHDLAVAQTFRSRQPGDISLVATQQIPPGASGFYYVRVIQKDDERAWSSPIWIGT
jgi:hypothetical protein